VLTPDAVPEGIEVLLPLAAIWGIGDDVDRSMAVAQADPAQLRQLITAVYAVDERVLYGWLAGADATSPTPHLSILRSRTSPWLPTKRVRLTRP
jgi:hypothetical protein